jgi:hypothetical protein
LEEFIDKSSNEICSSSTSNKGKLDFSSPPHLEYRDPDLIEELACSCHEAWRKAKGEEGYVLGESRNDDPNKGAPAHPRMKPYDELTEEWKADNRKPARLLLLKISMAGYKLQRLPLGATAPETLQNWKPALMKLEHDFWLRDHLFGGYEFNITTSDRLKLHRCIQEFAKLKEEDRALDGAIIDSIPVALEKCRYCLAKGV